MSEFDEQSNETADQQNGPETTTFPAEAPEAEDAADLKALESL